MCRPADQDRAADLHEESANLHETHAVEMREKGRFERAERAERIADCERELADPERFRADRHRRRPKPNRCARTDDRLRSPELERAAIR